MFEQKMDFYLTKEQIMCLPDDYKVIHNGKTIVVQQIIAEDNLVIDKSDKNEKLDYTFTEKQGKGFKLIECSLSGYFMGLTKEKIMTNRAIIQLCQDLNLEHCRYREFIALKRSFKNFNETFNVWDAFSGDFVAPNEKAMIDYICSGSVLSLFEGPFGVTMLNKDDYRFNLFAKEVRFKGSYDELKRKVKEEVLTLKKDYQKTKELFDGFDEVVEKWGLTCVFETPSDKELIKYCSKKDKKRHMILFHCYNKNELVMHSIMSLPSNGGDFDFKIVGKREIIMKGSLGDLKDKVDEELKKIRLSQVFV